MAETETTIASLTLDKQQAATALNVPPGTLLYLTRIGKIGAVRIGRHKRWLLQDLRAYVDGQKKQACVGQAGA